MDAVFSIYIYSIIFPMGSMYNFKDIGPRTDGSITNFHL